MSEDVLDMDRGDAVVGEYGVVRPRGGDIS